MNPEGVDNGYFEFLDGPGNVIIDNETANTLDFTVDNWGLYGCFILKKE